MSLTGDLAETPLSDLIDFFCMRQETVAVSVAADGGGPGGVLFIEAGALVDARLGDLVGEMAVRQALRLKRGDYRVEQGARLDEQRSEERRVGKECRSRW